tara:strand:- start:495 stop:1331 length:837 start_codon:yes stop_codon:yes gene_type:complete
MNNDSGLNLFQNSGYRNQRNKRQTLILDLEDTDNTDLAKASKFNIKLREPFIIDKPSEIYLDNFLTFNANLGDTHNHSAFVLKIDEFKINNGVASNISGDKLSGAIVIPNATNSVDHYFTAVVHKTKKFNYICDINPTTLHSINGQISDLAGNSIFHGTSKNENQYIYAITGITGWINSAGTNEILINNAAITSIDINTVGGSPTFTGPTILANVQVNGQTIYFSSETPIVSQALPTGKHVTVTTSGGSFTLASTNDSLQLLKGNGRFIAEFTIVSKE